MTRFRWMVLILLWLTSGMAIALMLYLHTLATTFVFDNNYSVFNSATTRLSTAEIQQITRSSEQLVAIAISPAIIVIGIWTIASFLFVLSQASHKLNKVAPRPDKAWTELVR